MTANKILINRAPVLTLWVAVVAERLGFNPDAFESQRARQFLFGNPQFRGSDWPNIRARSTSGSWMTRQGQRS
jgi:hypothetical protein